MQRLGGTVICVNAEHSSAQKGETLEDTVQTLSCYCDVLVLRHPTKGSSDTAAAVATKPIINAGYFDYSCCLFGLMNVETPLS